MTDTAADPVRFLSPTTGRALDRTGARVLSAGDERWPAPAGIPFLRADRPDLVAALLDRLDAGDETGATALALTDQDRHAPLPAPSEAAMRAMLAGEGLSYRDAMERLNLGPVAHYFAHRWSAPTLLSALALVAHHRAEGETVIDVACGSGHVARELALHGVPVVGLDLVFAKLWLARRFLLPESVPLAVADMTAPPVVDAGDASVLCHDALYFLDEKADAVAAMRTMAGEGGAVLLGHLHMAAFDHGSVAGRPLDAAGWAALLPGTVAYDDAGLAGAAVSGTAPEPADLDALDRVEAMALSTRPARAPAVDPALAPPDTGLGLNPLLVANGDGRLAPDWPTPAFAREYANADYLRAEAPPDHLLARAAHGHGGDPALADLARRRVLVALPEAW
ncbi:MAG: class I SAM-dependent methyltransferase [Paracoccaceae bacterium]